MSCVRFHFRSKDEASEKLQEIQKDGQTGYVVRRNEEHFEVVLPFFVQPELALCQETASTGHVTMDNRERDIWCFSH